MPWSNFVKTLEFFMMSEILLFFRTLCLVRPLKVTAIMNYVVPAIKDQISTQDRFIFKQSKS